jgi:hypothetical protein
MASYKYPFWGIGIVADFKGQHIRHRKISADFSTKSKLRFKSVFVA